jgi:hypothetical protein
LNKIAELQRFIVTHYNWHVRTSVLHNSHSNHYTHLMTPIRILTSVILSLAFVSCASQKADSYDTANPYGTADSGTVETAATEAANPVYDTPAAYEETSGPNASVEAATLGTIPRPAGQAMAIKPPTNGAAIIHTVVAGDTLSGLSAKYKVPAAAIKQANGMTKDTVVLGKKMAIPSAY